MGMIPQRSLGNWEKEKELVWILWELLRGSGQRIPSLSSTGGFLCKQIFITDVPERSSKGITSSFSPVQLHYLAKKGREEAVPQRDPDHLASWTAATSPNGLPCPLTDWLTSEPHVLGPDELTPRWVPSGA